MTIIALFVSHRSGDHIITLHPNTQHLKKELKSLKEAIHQDTYAKEAMLEDVDAVNELRSYHEFADTTWYHYQEIPYEAKISSKQLKFEMPVTRG